MRGKTIGALLTIVLAIVLWEKLDDGRGVVGYSHPVSTHWFNWTCERAAARMRKTRPSWAIDSGTPTLQIPWGREAERSTSSGR